MGVPDGLFHRARRLALRLGEVQGLVHGLVPGLLLGGDIGRRLAGAGSSPLPAGASITSPVPEGSQLGGVPESLSPEESSRGCGSRSSADWP